MSKKNLNAKTTESEVGLNDPDGFHGKSYSDFVAATEKCSCEEVKTYGMVCVTCGKPYEMKTIFTVNGSAGEWHHDIRQD